MFSTIFMAKYSKLPENRKTEKLWQNTVTKQTPILVISLEKHSVRNYITERLLKFVASLAMGFSWFGTNHSDTLKLVLWRYNTKYKQNGRGIKDIQIKFTSVQWKSQLWTDYERIKISSEKDSYFQEQTSQFFINKV